MDYSTIGTPMGNHECNFVEEKEPDGRLILGPCIECDMPAAEAIKELSTTKELLYETQNNRNDAWEKVAQLQARVEAYERVLKYIVAKTEPPVNPNVEANDQHTLFKCREAAQEVLNRTHKGESR